MAYAQWLTNGVSTYYNRGKTCGNDSKSWPHKMWMDTWLFLLKCVQMILTKSSWYSRSCSQRWEGLWKQNKQQFHLCFSFWWERGWLERRCDMTHSFARKLMFEGETRMVVYDVFIVWVSQLNVYVVVICFCFVFCFQNGMIWASSDKVFPLLQTTDFFFLHQLVAYSDTYISPTYYLFDIRYNVIIIIPLITN